MKNIHLIKTDKPSRLHLDKTKYLSYDLGFYSKDNKSFGSYQNIYITSNEEIKEGDWYENNGVIFKADDVFDEGNNPNNSNPRVTDFNNKIILTDNKDLIKDGVQKIDDEFLEWFVQNPSCEEVEIKLVEFEVDMELGDSCIEYGSYYEIIIPKEEPTAYHYLSCCRSIEECHCGKYPKQIKCYCGHTITCDCSPIESKQQTVEEAAKSNYDNKTERIPVPTSHWINSEFLQIQNFKEGAKWQAERRYSEEEVHKIIESYQDIMENNPTHTKYNDWFEQFKKK